MWTVTQKSKDRFGDEYIVAMANYKLPEKVTYRDIAQSVYAMFVRRFGDKNYGFPGMGRNSSFTAYAPSLHLKVRVNFEDGPTTLIKVVVKSDSNEGPLPISMPSVKTVLRALHTALTSSAPTCAPPGKPTRSKTKGFRCVVTTQGTVNPAIMARSVKRGKRSRKSARKLFE
jgi:hypothetical protein